MSIIAPELVLASGSAATLATPSSPGKPDILERIAQLAPLPTSLEINRETGKPTSVQNMSNMTIQITPRSEEKLRAALEIEFSSRGLKMAPNPKTPPPRPELPPEKDPFVEYYGTSPVKPDAAVEIEHSSPQLVSQDIESVKMALSVKSSENDTLITDISNDHRKGDSQIANTAVEHKVSLESEEDAALLQEFLESENIIENVAIPSLTSLDIFTNHKGNTEKDTQDDFVAPDASVNIISQNLKAEIDATDEESSASVAPLTTEMKSELANFNTRPTESSRERSLRLRADAKVRRAMRESVPDMALESINSNDLSASEFGYSDAEHHSPSRGASLSESNDDGMAEASYMVAAQASGAPALPEIDDELETTDAAPSMECLAESKLFTNAIAMSVAATSRNLPEDSPSSSIPFVSGSPIRVAEALRAHHSTEISSVHSQQNAHSASPTQHPIAVESLRMTPASPIIMSKLAHSPQGMVAPAEISAPELGPTERARDRSLKLRADAKARRAAEIAARKAAEEARLNAPAIDVSESLLVAKKAPASKKAKESKAVLVKSDGIETITIYPAPHAATDAATGLQAKAPSGAPPSSKRAKYPLTARRLASQADNSLAVDQDQVSNPFVIPEIVPETDSNLKHNSAVPAPQPVEKVAPGAKLPSQRAKLARQAAQEQEKLLHDGEALLQSRSKESPAKEAPQPVSSVAALKAQSHNTEGVKYVDDPVLNAVIAKVIADKNMPRNVYPKLATKQPVAINPLKSQPAAGSLYPGIGDSAKLPTLESTLPKARVSEPSEDLYDANGRRKHRPTLAGPVSESEKPAKKSKPLWKRVQEMEARRQAEEIREREAEYAKYRINRARAQPTKEEIEQHQREHDAIVENHVWKRQADDRKVIGNGVNNEPLDLQFNTNQQLVDTVREKMEALKSKRQKKAIESATTAEKPDASESNDFERERLDGFRKHKGDAHSHAGIHLETKYQKMVKNEIEQKKFERLLGEEEKRLRLEKQKMFSDQVRETFLPAGSSPKPGRISDDIHGVSASKRLRWSYDENFSYDGAKSPAVQAGGRRDKHSPITTRILDTVYSRDTSNLGLVHRDQILERKHKQSTKQLEGVRELLVTGEPMSPRVNKNGPLYLKEVMASDPIEDKMVNMYAKGFAQYFQ